MKQRYSALLICLLLVLTMLGGCGQPSSQTGEKSTTTSAVSEQNTQEKETTTTTITDEQTAPILSDATDDSQTGATQAGANSQTKTNTNTTTTTSNLSLKTNAPSRTTSTTTTVKPTQAQTYVLTPLPSSAYYGRTLLEKTDNGAALISAYQTLVSAVEAMQPTVKFSVSLTIQELTTAFYYYRSDYPQHFWLEGVLDYSHSGGKVVEVTLHYSMTAAQKKTAQTAFTAAADKYLKVAATGKNEYEREKLLHDSLAQNITYVSSAHAHDAYGALVEGKAVCEGYARAFQYLLYRAGIQSLIAEGSGINPSTGKSEAHAWNVVKIDGEYYHTDLTWDDTDSKKVPVVYAYFNVTTRDITQDHTVSSENCYPLPNCTAKAANYHVKNGTVLTSYSVDSVASLMKRADGNLHVYVPNNPKGFIDWFYKNVGAIADKLGISGAYSYGTVCVGKEVVPQLNPQ